jgi:chemotaxis protein methyltransferase CheR
MSQMIGLKTYRNFISINQTGAMVIANKKCVNSWDINSLASYVSDIVTKESGNVLGDDQKFMVINRLNKRLIDLGDLAPAEYFEHLKNNYSKEATHLVSLLTTHHTFFFREFCHFEYIIQNLDQIVNTVKSRNDTKIRVLSAACSRGQEVYSLAMLLNFHLKNYPGISYEIIGTDIDPESVKIAKNGVYPFSEVKSIPQIYLEGNWQKGTGEISRFAKVKSHLKNNCIFKVMNLLSPDEAIPGLKFDLVFCRNVFIYFNLEDVEKIVGNFRKYLHKDALFITGLSESLKSLSIEKQTYAPSIYCFDAPSVKNIEQNHIEVLSLKDTISGLIPKPIKVLAVDDSSTVLKLLTKIFSSDPEFQLVGTATSGKEAEEFIKNNAVDAMTLDIHMPEMDGVEYLKRNFRPYHPKVVVVSSASREDTRYAQETIRYGASDFVEKPALNNLTERADEIKNKIKMSFLNTSKYSSKSEKIFSDNFKIDTPESKARAFLGSFSDKEKIVSVIGGLKNDQPPTFLFFEGNSNFLNMFQKELSVKYSIKLIEEENEFKMGTLYLGDFKRDFPLITERYGGSRLSLSIFGIVSKFAMKFLLDSEIGQVLIEDNDSINNEIKEVVTDIFPWTSFSHVGTEFLAKLK